MAGLVLVVVFAAMVIITIALGVRLVPQGSKFVVQRLGKYLKTLNPGLNIIIPYIDTVAYKVSTKDQIIDTSRQECISLDNAVLQVNAVAFINVISPEKAVYGIENYHLAIQNLVQTTLRSIIGEMKLDDALSSRDQIKAKLKQGISDDLADWGITLRGVEIQDINPSDTMQQAMEAQAAAERQRRATVTRAEGDKEAAILEADGRLAAAERDAKAKEVQAEASKKALQLVLESAGTGHEEIAIGYLLGESYIKAIQQSATSQNAKTILLPADLQASIRGLIGGLQAK
ncbi:SPFH domain-containing protein [Pelobacter seleniigenes]|uniref:SPFH domain-containing protein n=1 Tax=Pelobacter seleniigenes TaxID=407188 RepID=UPI0004A7420C|nr:stomatin-like protein [Pelobacter seleniigenes]